MDFPAILASQTTTVFIPEVAAEQKTYDRWWIKRMTIQAPDPNADAVAILVMTKGFKNQDGFWELSPNAGDTKQFTVDALFHKASTDPELAQVLGGLLMVISKIGTEMNIL